MRPGNAAAFVSAVLTLVACGGGGASFVSPEPARPVCRMGFVPPAGFERTDGFRETYPDRIGLRVGFRDRVDRELHAFAGIPGEFGEGLPAAGTVELVGGRIGQLFGGPNRVWVLLWEEGGVCDPHALLGTGFERRGFLAILAEAGITHR